MLKSGAMVRHALQPESVILPHPVESGPPAAAKERAGKLACSTYGLGRANPIVAPRCGVLIPAVLDAASVTDKNGQVPAQCCDVTVS